ncbi:MAG: DHH family phosphoesterase [Rickettsiales bacterium]|jgi:phosphoesterase RecJ-like protein|nr:DHH family phosphoesterase [Rickettsiales bacterium]
MDFAPVAEKIKCAKSIGIIGHKNSDGDSLCSILALHDLIKLNFGKDAVCCYDGNIPDYLDFVPNRDLMRFVGSVPEEERKFDLLFVLDTGIFGQIGELQTPVVNSAGFVIKIDHHPDTGDLGGLNYDFTFISCAQAVFHIARELGWKIDFLAAKNIMIGIINDSGRFAYDNTGRAFSDAAALVDEYGIVVQEIYEEMNKMPRKDILAEAFAVAKAEFFFEGRVAIATIDRAAYKNLDGKASFAMEWLGMIEGVEYVVMLKEAKQDEIHISFRSKKMPVNGIAAALGGGGHVNASGAKLLTNLPMAKAAVIKEFGKELRG